MSDQQRIADLERQLAAANRRIASLEQQLRPQPEVIIGRCPLPTESEMRALYNNVIAEYPSLADPGDVYDQFTGAFRYVCTLSSTTPNKFSKLANVSWLDRCRDWLRARDLNTDLSLAAFSVALLSHNVETTYDMNRWPHDFNIGIEIGDHRLPTGDGWRAALAGRFRKPEPIVVPRTQGVQQLLVQPSR